jgi:hypothetical protein
MNYNVKMTKRKFDRTIIAIAKDIVLSAEFADRDTYGHQSRSDIMQAATDLQRDLENRRTLRMANLDYELPPEEKKILEDGEDALDTACEQWGIKNPLDDYENN